jgi:exopolyphosphatase / guanosine-5'-triphosphate,3'-diphosphate pyrophosphatase
MPLAARAQLPGLERGRADIIVHGIAIVLATFRRAGADSLVVSDFGLREGLLVDMLDARREASSKSSGDPRI